MAGLLEQMQQAGPNQEAFNASGPENQIAIAVKQLMLMGMSQEQAMQIAQQKFGQQQQPQQPQQQAGIPPEIKAMLQSGDPAQIQKAMQLMNQGAPAQQGPKSLFDM